MRLNNGRITLRDVAGALGVSVATVSNAYNRPDQLSTDLRNRILETARTMGYVGPDPVARSLRRGRTGVIGVVYDAPLEYAFGDPAAALFLGSVAHALQHEHLSLLLLSSPENPDPIRSASVDGFIIYTAASGSELQNAVLSRGLPTVLIEQDEHAYAASVGIDDMSGAQAAAQHLIELGHQHIGIVSLELGPNRLGGLYDNAIVEMVYRPSLKRLEAYKLGIAEAPAAQTYITEVAHNSSIEAELKALELLRIYPQITAILCMSDVLAQGVMHAAQTLKRRIPEDLSIIGYDDLPSSVTLNLTTVWQPTAEKGRQAGEAILALLQGERPAPVILPTRLVVRSSTAKAPIPA